MSSYNATHIFLLRLLGSGCNSCPTTFSFSLGPTDPILGSKGPGHSGSPSGVSVEGGLGVSGTGASGVSPVSTPSASSS